MVCSVPHHHRVITARVLYDQFISIFSAPETILSNHGANFLSCIIQMLCDMFGIKKVKTTPYHAQCNGQVEHFHQTLMRMVGKVWYNHQTNWRKHLPKVVQAYNGTCSTVMGYSPHYLMFGLCHCRPIDLHLLTIQLEKQHSLLSYLVTQHK